MNKRKAIVIILILLLYTILVWVACWLFLAGSTMIAVGSVLTACGFTLAGVYWLVSSLSAKTHPPEQPQPRSDPGKPLARTDDPDLQAVQQLVKEAEGKLARSTRLASKHVRPRLADLPLYILTGVEGSGKTTTFLQACLEEEPLAGQIHSGPRIVPTQIANFWYAKDSLIAEASGRIFMDDSGRWSRFVASLNGNSPASFLKTMWSGGAKRNSLRGLILFIDSNLFTDIPDAARISTLARVLQDRLRVAAQTIACDIPVWVIFSKADGIRHFREYFSRLRQPEDQQPLGCSLDPLSAGQRSTDELYAEAETGRLNETFNALYHSLAHYRLTFLARETDPARKPAIYEFPREMKRMRSALVQFLVDVFRPNPLQPEPQLRGFYFMGTRPVPRSGGGDTLSLDRSIIRNISDSTRMLRGDAVQAELKRAAAEAAGSAAVAESFEDRGCFVSQIFHDIVQTSPIPVRRYHNRRADVFRNLAFGGAIALCALLGLWAAVSAWNNYSFLKSVEAASESVEGREFNLDALDGLREHLVLLNSYEHSAPWSMGFLLYPAQGLIEPARNLYFKSFRENMLDPVAQSLSKQLGGLPAQPDAAHPYNPTYDSLKTYLTVTTQACAVEPPLAQTLSGIWFAGRTPTDDSSKKALRQFEFYSQELKHKRVPFSIEAKTSAVDRGRTYLANSRGEDRIYRELVDKANQMVKQPIRLADYAPKYQQVLSGVGDIPGAFTHAGSGVMSDLISNEGSGGATGESCVLGTKLGDRVAGLMEGDALSNRLKELYASDYARKWKALLAAVQVKAYNNPKDAASKLSILEDADSPLLGLLYMAHENAVAAVSSNSKLMDSAKNVGGKVGSRITDRFRVGRAAKEAAELAGSGSVPRVSSANPAPPQDAFQSVHTLFTAQASQRNWNDAANASYTKALGALRKTMEGLAASNTDPLNAEAKKNMDEGLDLVRGEIGRKFDRSPEAIEEDVKRLLIEPFERARPLIVIANPTGEINVALVKLCAQMKPLQQKYPFNPSPNAAEASLAEASAIFSPQTGALWAFYKQRLAPILVKAGKNYEVKADAPAGVKLDQTFIDSFNRMAHISDVLFADGSATPSMRYKLNVLPNPNPGVKAITLTIDGQTGQGSHQYTSPAGSPQGLKLDVQSSDTTVSMASYEGPWSIFQLMAEADPHAPGAREVTLTKLRHGRGIAEPVIVGGKEVTVHIRIEEFPGGVETAFDKGFFSCRCPGKAALN